MAVAAATVERPPPVVAILGPTASGKSALALELAVALGGEILCCDSMQVYRGMDIGTAKAAPSERASVPHHLLDVVAPDEQYHAARWAEGARSLVEECEKRERLPIIVGGTGLYFRALVRGLFEAPRPNPDLRARHQAEAAQIGVPALHERLRSIDPEAAAKILPGDLVRVSRALEIYEQTGTTITELRRQQAHPPLLLRLFSVLLDFDMDFLRPRIAERVDAMIAAGFLDEIRSLRVAGFGAARSMQGLGYKQLGLFLDGVQPLDAAVADIKTATVAYARRQRTWFRREDVTLRTQRPLPPSALVRLIRGWLLT